VHSQHAAASALNQSCVVQGVLNLGKYSDFAAHKRGVHALHVIKTSVCVCVVQGVLNLGKYLNFAAHTRGVHALRA